MFRLLRGFLRHPRRTTLVVAMGAGLLLGHAALAKDDDGWKVHGKLLGEPKKANDVSGIGCAAEQGFPRLCLLVDDNTQGAQIVMLDKDSLAAGSFIRLISETFEGRLLDLDAEAAAYADGFFYVVGSHGRPRHETEIEEAAKDKIKARAMADAQTKATSHVFRVRLDTASVDATGRLTAAPEIRDAVSLPKFLAGDAQLAPFFGQRMEKNGLNIEGTAVRGGTIYFGMRGPVIDGKDAAILAVPLTALFDGQPGSGQLHRLNLSGSRGIRDLISYDGNFLMIAGPVNDPSSGEVGKGDYSVFWWDGDKQTKRLADLDSYGKRVKPEGIVPLERRNGKLRVLLFFDGPDEGEPHDVEIDAP